MNQLSKNQCLQKTIFIAAIALAAVLIFYPILGNEFVSDDFMTIVGNPAIQENINPFYFFGHPEAFFNHSAAVNYRPIGVWILSLEFHLFSFNASYYHAVSIFIHFLNAAILFLILLELFPGEIFLSFAGSLIFLIHPVQTEAVAWITLHHTLFMNFFGLFALFLILRKGLIPSFVYYLWFPAAFFAVFSKDQFVILPVLLFCLLWLAGKNVKKYYWEMAAASSIAILYFLLRAVFVKTFTQSGFWQGSLLPPVLTMSNAFAKYLCLVIKGFPLTVNYNDFPLTLRLNPSTVFSIFLLAAVFGFLVFSVKRFPLAALGIFWFFIPLGPVSNIPFPLATIMNERFLYPAMPGAIIFFLYFCGLAKKKLKEINFGRVHLLPEKTTAAILLLAILTYYCGITLGRLKDWKNEETLWRAAFRVSPNILTLINHIRALEINGKHDEAVKEYSKYKILPDDYSEEAKNLSKKSVILTAETIKDSAAVLFAGHYSKNKKFNEAEVILKNRLRPVSDEPSMTIAFELGKVLLESGKYAEASKIFDGLNKSIPEDDQILFYLILSRRTENKNFNAAPFISRLKSPNLKMLMPGLIEAYQEKKLGHPEKVYSLLAPVLSGRPAVLLEPYFWLGEAEEELGQEADAKKTYLNAFFTNPYSIEARNKIKL